MPIFEGERFPLRAGMIIKFKHSRKKDRHVFIPYVQGRIKREECNSEGRHIFDILTDKGTTLSITGKELYSTAEIISLGTFTCWDNLACNFALKKSTNGRR